MNDLSERSLTPPDDEPEDLEPSELSDYEQTLYALWSERNES